VSFVFVHPLLGPASPLGNADQSLIAGLMDEEDNADFAAHRWTTSGGRLALDGLPSRIGDIIHGRDLTLAPQLNRTFRKTYLVGTDTAYAAACGLRPFFEEMLDGTPCEAIDGTEFAYYARQAVNADCLVIVLAGLEAPWRSLEATVAARALGATTLVLAAGADARYDHHADLSWRVARPDHAIAGPSLLLAMAYRLGLLIGAQNGVARDRLAQLEAALESMPAQVQKALTATDADMTVASQLVAARHIVVAGNGAARAAAAASGQWFGEILARPVTRCGLEALANLASDASVATLVIVPNGLSVRRAQQALAHRHKDRAIVLVVAEDSPLYARGNGFCLTLPAMIERLSALVYLAAGQRLACAMAERGQP
jgi:glucosamine 6-phosphate synthetase-like amidotransferase/phosphosugar isomerase protein